MGLLPRGHEGAVESGRRGCGASCGGRFTRRRRARAPRSRVRDRRAPGGDAGARGGARELRPRQSRMARATSGWSIAARIRTRPPQSHWNASTANTRFSSCAQVGLRRRSGAGPGGPGTSREGSAASWAPCSEGDGVGLPAGGLASPSSVGAGRTGALPGSGLGLQGQLGAGGASKDSSSRSRTTTSRQLAQGARIPKYAERWIMRSSARRAARVGWYCGVERYQEFWTPHNLGHTQSLERGRRRCIAGRQ
jgi:hypothetical protein